MLVLSRYEGERVIITTPCGDQIEVEVVQIRGERKVRLGIVADPKYTIHREEVQRRIDAGEARRAGR